MNEIFAQTGKVIQKTLIDGNAYKTVLGGLWVTVYISAASIILGTLLGVIVCIGRLSRIKWISRFFALYIAVLRGSPVLLLLMLFYYVVFAKSPLSAPSIAVLAFALNVSAHTAECFRAAYCATDKMQNEAARTLGFSKFEAFRLVTLPQTLHIAKPTYLSALVNTIQWTSVVGYVTITDLTRIINNIGARTMQPFFMIVLGIILYLGLSYLCYGIFALCDLWSSYRKARRCAG